MNWEKLIFILFFTIIFFSCGNSKKSDNSLPGTIVAKEEMPIIEDSLNKSKFSVAVKADSLIEQGVWGVTAIWGNNNAESKFTMPKGGESLKPLLRIGHKPYSYIIGFKTDKDTTFNEYFEVSGLHGTIKMIYTKAYSFE